MRIIKCIAIFVLAWTISAQGQREERVTLLPPSEVKTARHSYPPPGGAITGSWQPAPADIASAETKLAQICQMTPLGWPATIHIEHPEQYYRQYLGVIQKGKKVLYINAIRVWETEETPPRNWRTHFYWVVDGGLGYWQVIYDPATQQFSGLQINPRA